MQTTVCLDKTEKTKGRGFLYSIYDKIIQSANSPRAIWAFCGVSFAESSFFPLPPDLLMIPIVLANRSLAWRLAFLGTITSVLGGLVGYAIGYYLFNTLGDWIIQTYNLSASFAKFQQGFDEWGFWIIALKGLTPIPYKLVTIASGVAHFPLETFVIASVIARAFRFYLLAGLLWWLGPWARDFVEKYLTLCLIGSLGIIVLGFVIVKLIG
jgi:membrane protein YqaA with SNARE-associated domain